MLRDLYLWRIYRKVALFVYSKAHLEYLGIKKNRLFYLLSRIINFFDISISFCIVFEEEQQMQSIKKYH